MPLIENSFSFFFFFPPKNAFQFLEFNSWRCDKYMLLLLFDIFPKNIVKVQLLVLATKTFIIFYYIHLCIYIIIY